MKDKSSDLDQDIAQTYNEFKQFEGRRYTGMKVGGHHKWYYDQGVWKEKKVAPDRWEFNYAVPKRRAGHAPPGSGVPVGTEYHWYILAHQNVRKLDENTYSTSMTGIKYKLAHKRAGGETWSASDRAQRKLLIRILQQMIHDLSQEPEPTPTEVQGNGQRRNGQRSEKARATSSAPGAKAAKPAAGKARKSRATV